MVDYIDRPITSEEEDLLDRAEFIRTLAKALVGEASADGGEAGQVHSKGNVIGLTGEWGSGKSSILNLLAAYLGTRSKTIVVQFNPWMFLSQADLLNGFFNELRFQLGKSQLDQLKELLGLIDQYRESLSSAKPLFSAVSPWLGSGWSLALSIVPRVRHPAPQPTRKKIEEKIKSTGAAVVVLIDELDRVEDDEVRAVARLIKAVGDIQGISYLVAYDPKRVVDALGRGSGPERSKSGEAYLEKLIQLVVPVRPLLGYEVLNLLKGALAKQGYHDLVREDEALKDLVSSLNTPRDIKRVVANFAPSNQWFMERSIRLMCCSIRIFSLRRRS